MDSSSFRTLQAFVASVIFTVALFWSLQTVISRHGAGMSNLEALPNIDFVRLKKDTEVETRTRRKPPPPPPPKTPPPPPKLQVITDTPPKNEPLPFNIPNLGLSANVGGGPFIGEMGVGGPPGGMFEGDIIPLQRIAPQYPRQAARDGIEGTVKLEITVNPDGTVREAHVLSSNPRGVFDAAAVTAVLRWRFKPKVVDGQPVAQKGVQEVGFTLGAEE